MCSIIAHVTGQWGQLSDRHGYPRCMRGARRGCFQPKSRHLNPRITDGHMVCINRSVLDYRQLNRHLLALNARSRLENRRLVAVGTRGLVYRGRFRGRDAAEKIRNPNTQVNRLDSEAYFLRLLNPHGIGPTLFNVDDHGLVCEFIEGQLIAEYARQSSPRQSISVIAQVLRQCHRLDQLGINKCEMHRASKHVIVRASNDVVLVDFERCYRSRKPKNVTQFLQFLCGPLDPVLRARGIPFRRRDVIPLARAYKQVSSASSFQAIVDHVKKKGSRHGSCH